MEHDCQNQNIEVKEREDAGRSIESCSIGRNIATAKHKMRIIILLATLARLQPGQSLPVSTFRSGKETMSLSADDATDATI
jgi:hypothetical protein